jgi:hypothetical protein
MSDTASPSEAREFAGAFRAFLEWVYSSAHGEERNEVVSLVTGFLGPEGTAHSVVSRELPPLEHVNLQTALDAWTARPGRAVDVHGIALPPQYQPPNLQQLLARTGPTCSSRRWRPPGPGRRRLPQQVGAVRGAQASSSQRRSTGTAASRAAV